MKGKQRRKVTQSPVVSIVMGSDSDLPVMKQAGDALKHLGVPFDLSIVSAHRTPYKMMRFAEGAKERGIRVIIAGAGGAAHLPGMVASFTELPVIGVPIPLNNLQGMDSLLSIVQMPKGVPVATVAIGSGWNAGLLAAQIVATGGESPDEVLLGKIRNYKDKMGEEIEARDKKVRHRYSPAGKR